MSDLGLQRVGPTVGGSGTAAPFRADITGAQIVSDGHGRYAEAVRRGNVYFINGTNITATAFTGGAGGVPALSVMNPTGSGKTMELIGVAVGIRTATNATASVTFNLWAGASVMPTGTPITLPKNSLTLLSGGSVGSSFNNTAATGSTAIAQVMPVASYYFSTAVGAFFTGNTFVDVAGLAVCAPGNFIALGASASIAVDVSMFWEEVPVLA